MKTNEKKLKKMKKNIIRGSTKNEGCVDGSVQGVRMEPTSNLKSCGIAKKRCKKLERKKRKKLVGIEQLIANCNTM